LPVEQPACHLEHQVAIGKTIEPSTELYGIYPTVAAHISVLKRLCYINGCNLRATVEISYSSGDFKHPLVGSGAELQGFRCLPQQGKGIRIGPTKALHIGR
jgi:hypothetical protein